MASPYQKDTLFSLFPGGGFSLTQPIDMAIDTSISVRASLLQLEVSDTTTDTPIASVGYPILGLPVQSCIEDHADTNTCPLPGDI